MERVNQLLKALNVVRNTLKKEGNDIDSEIVNDAISLIVKVKASSDKKAVDIIEEFGKGYGL